ADGEVGLAHPGRAEDEEILAVLEEVARGQCLDLLLVEGGLVGEVEGLEALHEREASERRPHRDVLGGLRRDLLAEEPVQEVGVGELLRGGVLEQRLQSLAALEEPQALQELLEALELGGRHGVTAPAPLAVSYTVRSRTSTSAPSWRGSRAAGATVE